MNAVKASASSVAFVSGAVAAYAGYVSKSPQYGQVLIAALGILLIVDSLVCFLGWKFAFAGSAAVSALVAVACVLCWSAVFSDLHGLTVAVALVSAALSILAFRSTSSISEQGNPMNLPVFG